MRSFVSFHAPVIAYALLIFILSSIPTLSPPDLGLDFEDKLAHAVEFGILGFLLWRSFLRLFQTTRTVYMMTGLCGVVYGGLDEIHQYFVPGRYCSAWDFLADGVGIILAIGIIIIVRRKDLLPKNRFF